jgi:hypothetical protein
MAYTYKLIASALVGSGGAASLDFTSIPQTYTNLCILASPRSTNAFTGENIYIRFNDSTSSYNWVNFYGTGSGSASIQNGSDNQAGTAVGASATTSFFGNVCIYIPEYTTTKYKTLISDSNVENNATRGDNTLWGTMWSNTAAITSIKLFPSTGVWAQDSNAYLYGITKS